MKGNAPKIIWLSPNEYRSNEPSCFWSESKRTDYDIEYIRTDTFMEKIQKELDNLYHKWFDDLTGMEVSEEGAEIGALDMAYEAFQEIINSLKNKK